MVVPLSIAYGVLAVVLVKLPLGTKAIVRSLLPGDRSPLALRIGIALVAQVALTAAAVYLWALAAPVLLRPVWSWRDLEPTVEAVRPLQEDAATSARAGALDGGPPTGHPGPPGDGAIARGTGHRHRGGAARGRLSACGGV